MWGCFLMSGVKILHFLKDWWKSIPIHQNYTMALTVVYNDKWQGPLKIIIVLHPNRHWRIAKGNRGHEGPSLWAAPPPASRHGRGGELEKRGGGNRGLVSPGLVYAILIYSFQKSPYRWSGGGGGGHLPSRSAWKPLATPVQIGSFWIWTN